MAGDEKVEKTRQIIVFKRVPPTILTWDVLFYFLSTNYHSFSPGMKSCPATDFRFPHIIDSYNDETREVFSANNIAGFIDTTRVIRPLCDLSFDSAHYQGTVGVALANLGGNCFYNNMC